MQKYLERFLEFVRHNAENVMNRIEGWQKSRGVYQRYIDLDELWVVTAPSKHAGIWYIPQVCFVTEAEADVWGERYGMPVTLKLREYMDNEKYK